jgi:hypothetical protein
MLRLTVFIIALLLLAGSIEPSRAWFIALAVVSGVSLVCSGPFAMFRWVGRRSRWRGDRFARRMERRFERQWSWDSDW